VEEKLGLTDRILAGESGAFEELVNQHQRLVNHVVFRMIPDKDDRLDICQDVFMKVYQNLGSFRADAKLSTWIARIAYNRCVDYLSKKRIPVSDQPLEEAVQFVAGREIGPDDRTAGRDVRKILEGEIERLPVQYKTIITLFHLEEMSYDEIGKIMKLPEGTVKSYLFRARRMLKDRLAAKYSREEL